MSGPLLRRSLVLVTLLSCSAAAAGTPLDSISVSPDTTTALSSVFVNDEDAIVQMLASGNGILYFTGAPPPSTDLTGFHITGAGDLLLSFDTTVVLHGGTFDLLVTPRDVVRYHFDFLSLTLSIAFDGAAAGVPLNAAIDAIGEIDGDLLLSFDVTVGLPAIGQPLFAEDEDVLRYNDTLGEWSMFFDGSANGVSERLDVDALHRLDNGHLLMSFDASGAIGGVSFDDEDALEFTPGAGIWEMAYDGSARAPGSWGGTDLDALYAIAAATAPTPTNSPTSTPSSTPTVTPTSARTATPSATSTATRSPTPTASPTHSFTSTPSPTPTPTLTASQTYTRTATPTPTPTESPTATPSATQTFTPTSTTTATPSLTASPTHSLTPTASPTPSFTSTPTPTSTASQTRAPADTATPTPPEPVASATPTTAPARTPRPCTGDCNGDGQLTVDEVVRGVNIALGTQSIDACHAMDSNGDNQVTVDEIVTAVNHALNGCPS